jgi:DNA-binding PucR family transcriptional regulator
LNESVPTSLRALLDALSEPLVYLLTAPHGLDVEVGDVAIVDPEDVPDTLPTALVLVIGARGTAAAPVIRAVARDGAVAVAVKDARYVADTASDAGIALLDVGEHARWAQLESLARGVIDAARTGGDDDSGEALGDLFSLAQTIATVTGGLVSIEDTDNRVLAYSRAVDEADELRRLSILGLSGPERYLAMLRKWGVYQRLRAGEGVVPIDERPELGIRRRLAAGIFAGSQPLGSLWVQEGATVLSSQAEAAVLGASRMLAPHLIRRLAQAGSVGTRRDSLLAGVLDGRLNVGSIAEDIGANPERPALVVAFTLHQTSAGSVAERPLHHAELINLISLHTAAYRRSSLVGVRGRRVYALLPDLAEGAEASILVLARTIVGFAQRRLGLPVRAALGSIASRLADAPASCADADRVLDAMGRDARTLGITDGVGAFTDLRAQVALSEVVAFLAAQPRTRDPGLARLVDYDAHHGDVLIPSLNAYLVASGDVRGAAHRLGVHANTLRYRIRRCTEISGMDLNDPDQRLFAQLQLRLLVHHGQ